MNVGDSDYLCETVYPSNATNQTVTWCSSDDSVAEVNTYTGFVRAKKSGIATITACTVDGGYSASCVVTVNDPNDVKYINITKDSSGEYSIILTKFNNGDFYFQAYGEENDEWGELYSLSQANIDWLNNTYNSYYNIYISQGRLNTNLIGHRVYLAKNKLINTINAGTWNVTINSDEFYGMWMHYTRFETAYAQASLLLADMVETATIVVSTIYQAVVAVKSLSTLANVRKTITPAGYKSMATAYQSFLILKQLVKV